MSFSMFSWNILGPATRDVVDYGFIPNDYGRLGKHLEIISHYKEDILCFQEVDLTTLHLFNNFLSQEYQQVAYHEKGVHGGVVVYAKKNKFELIESVGSILKNSYQKSSGAFCGAILKNILDDSLVFVASVHLSKSSHPQEVFHAASQMSDLATYLNKKGPVKMVFAGDYNTLYEDMKKVVLPLMSQIFNQNFLMFEHESCTTYAPDGELSSIDHIMYSGLEISLQKSCVVTSKYYHIKKNNFKKSSESDQGDIVYTDLPSDHSPVLAYFI